MVSAVASTLAGFLAFFFSALSFVFTMSGDALGPIVVVAALGAAMPELLAGLLAVPGLSRAYRPAAPADPLLAPPGAPSSPAAPPVRI